MPLDLNSLGGHEFEDLIEQLLIKMGFATEGRKPSADGGIDIVAVSSQPLVSGRYIIQCKRYSHSVSSPVVRDLYGVVNASNANKGILITTSSFTSDAVEFAHDKPLELIDGAKLADLLQKYSLILSSEELKVGPVSLAAGMLRNELSGLSNRFETALHDIDMELNLANRKTFGNDRDERTLESYRQFTLDILARLKQAISASTTIITSLNDFLHSNSPEPVDSRKIGGQFNELAQYLLEILRDLKRSIPPNDFVQVHRMYEDAVHRYLVDFGSFLQQTEEVLEQGSRGVSGNISYKMNFDEGRQIALSFKDAWDKAHQKLTRRA